MLQELLYGEQTAMNPLDGGRLEAPFRLFIYILICLYAHLLFPL